MGTLTLNFSLHEFRCRCGCGGDYVDMDLVHALQRLRDILGVPLRVTSGFRCATHNRHVGGAKGSQHLLGFAADVTGAPVVRMLLAALRVPAFRAGGIGTYRTWIHLDVRTGRARWVSR